MQRGWQVVGLAAAAAWLVAREARRAARAREERIHRLRSSAAARRRVVILGAGFAGLNAAHALVQEIPPESGWEIVLVDRHNYFLFTPLLYHAATGLVDPASILYPVRRLTRAPHFQFRAAEVRHIDLRRRAVLLDGEELSAEILVLALGSTTNFFGRREALAPALPLKSAADALRIRNCIVAGFERADSAVDPEERRRSLTFAVVGGGATGLELAGAIQGFIRGTLRCLYPRIAPEETRVVVLESKAEVLPGISRDLASFAVRRLRQLGVEVRLECPVERVTERGLWTREGEFLPAGLVVWAAGVRAAPAVEDLPLPKLRDGRLPVTPYLEIQGAPGCYAIGDAAAFTDPESGRPLPANAAVAVRQGARLAKILAARLEGRWTEPFAYQPVGELVSLGRHEAVAEVKGVRFTGLPAWLLWRAFYLLELKSLKNRLAVLLDWVFAYLYQRDTARLELPELRPGALIAE